jgi:hypothetical protein
LCTTKKTGPFNYWHHQYLFKYIDSGIEMNDIMNYAAPFGVLGRNYGY